MNIRKMLAAQDILDRRIIKQHNLEKMTITREYKTKRLVSLLVELSEFINETRCFKFWSKTEPARHLMLEEYVDGVHFFCGISNENNWQNYIIQGVETLHLSKEKCVNAEDLFLKVNFNLSAMHVLEDDREIHFKKAWEQYLLLGTRIFGFTLTDIEVAYFEKNQINHHRQDTNY